MPRVLCPSCRTTVNLPEEKVFFANRVSCPDCRAELEVINERPVRVEWVSGKRGKGWISEWLTQDETGVDEGTTPS